MMHWVCNPVGKSAGMTESKKEDNLACSSENIVDGLYILRPTQQYKEIPFYSQKVFFEPLTSPP